MSRALILAIVLLVTTTASAVESLSFKHLIDVTTSEPEQAQEALNDYIGREVQIRGFIYINDDGQYVLSSRPGMGSCCQKLEENVPHQIFLDGDLIAGSGGKTVSVQGLFAVQPVRNQEGKLIELYRLKDPRVSNVEGTTAWLLIAVVAGIAMLFMISGMRARSH